MSKRDVERKLTALPEPEADDDNPEWTEEDFARAKPVHELPAEEQAAIMRAMPKTKVRGPQKSG